MFGSPRVTVITPTYNRLKFLPETIRSVRRQKVPMHYIIIDDGSTDDTRSYFRWRPHPSIRFLTQNNAGEVRTVNRGLRMVETEFFTVVNSDDPLLPGSLAKMTAALDRNPEALAAYCDWQIIDENSQTLGEVHIGSFDLSRMLSTFNLPIGPGAVFRTRCLDEIGYRNPQLRYSADLDYWFRIGLTGRMCYVPEVLATHRVHPTSASVQGRGSQLSSEVSYLSHTYGNHPKRTGGPSRTKVFATGHFAAAFACADARGMSRELLRSMFWHPAQFLEHVEDMGLDEIARLLKAAGAEDRGKAGPILKRAVAALTRSQALRLWARAIMHDPAGTVHVVREMGEGGRRAALSAARKTLRSPAGADHAPIQRIA
jgi:hypothetical protein